jgi:hypothetical protein
VATGRVAALVEQRRRQHQADQNQEQRGLGQHVANPVPRAVPGEQPSVHGDQRGQHGGDHQRAEQDGEHAGEAADRRRGDQRPAGGESQQRRRPRSGRDAALGRDDPERNELRREQILDVSGGHRAGALLPQPGGDLGDVPGAVGGSDEAVQQLGELDHLAVAATDQEDRAAQAGSGELAEHVEPGGQARPGRDVVLGVPTLGWADSRRSHAHVDQTGPSARVDGTYR